MGPQGNKHLLLVGPRPSLTARVSGSMFFGGKSGSVSKRHLGRTASLTKPTPRAFERLSFRLQEGRRSISMPADGRRDKCIGIPLTKCLGAATSPSVPEDYTLPGLAACRIRGKSEMRYCFRDLRPLEGQTPHQQLGICRTPVNGDARGVARS